VSVFGSWDHAERLAIGELTRKGWSRLAALVGGHVASFGDVCYQTDARLAEKLRKPNGRGGYHPESIARVRRKLRDAGVITSERVFVGAKLPNAKFRSSRGTTLKTFIWRAVEQKNPFSRREQRQRRQQQAAATRAVGDAVPPKTRHIVYSAEHTYSGRQTELDPELQRLAQAAQQAQERNDQRRALQAARNAGGGSSILRAPERPPPE